MIAIGVPTVIDARTLILDAAKASEAEAEQAGVEESVDVQKVVDAAHGELDK